MELHKDVLNIIEENMEFYNTDNLIDTILSLLSGEM